MVVAMFAEVPTNNTRPHFMLMHGIQHAQCMEAVNEGHDLSVLSIA